MVTYSPYRCAAPHSLHVSWIVFHSLSGLIFNPDSREMELLNRVAEIENCLRDRLVRVVVIGMATADLLNCCRDLPPREMHRMLAMDTGSDCEL